MANIHRIRLRKPWSCRKNATLCRWTRSFGHPGRLEPTDRLWLVVSNVYQSGRVLLNGCLLGLLPGDGRECRFEITGRLDYRNQLLVELDAGDQEPADHPRQSPPGDVVLEIESATGPSA